MHFGRSLGLPPARCGRAGGEAPRGIRSTHRGRNGVAFKQMVDMGLADMDLMGRDLTPMRRKRAERETAKRMRSRPVAVN